MTAGRPRFVRLYLRFLGLLAVILAFLTLIGHAPTRRLGGAEAVPAMLAGCGVGAVSSALGALPMALGSAVAPAGGASRFLAATALRLVLALALTLSLALSGAVPVRPFLLWVGLSYLGLLAADVWLALAVARGAGGES